ncbi:hypothetical protein LEN26_007721 [Aphanomyces euteiches]|nr:hypothetical protein AeMF1_004607 [Aphanomyces euteiches]KAH9131391.1 hypothetical protein LEN26_007721 [Aphanomyces euteiches]KAH9190224.1 hypothetical protein AeNC1_007796 [Aphanomyces euteiches]
MEDKPGGLTLSVDAFRGAPPSSLPRRRSMLAPQYSTIRHADDSTTPSSSNIVRRPTATEFATVATTDKPTRAPKPLSVNTMLFKTESPKQADKPPTISSIPKRTLVRSMSTLSLAHSGGRPSSPRSCCSHDTGSDTSSDGSRVGTKAAVSPTASKLRFPLRKKEASPPKTPTTKSFVAATPRSSPEKDQMETAAPSLDVRRLSQRVEELVGEKDQVQLEYDDLIWKYKQTEMELQSERAARTAERAQHEVREAELRRQIESLQMSAQEWEAKHIQAASGSCSHAITMAEFEEKEAEIARLWNCVDSMAQQLTGIAELAGARVATQDCTMEYMKSLLDGKTQEIETMRGALYDTVTLCFLHELAQSHDHQLLTTFMAGLGSDTAAFEWIKERFCAKIIDDGRFSKLENCIGTVAIHAGTSRIMAGIVQEDSDGLLLPALDVTMSMAKDTVAEPRVDSLVCVQGANGSQDIYLEPQRSRRQSCVERSTRKSVLSMVFDELNIAPRKYKVAFVHKPLLPKREKARLTDTLLQDFGVAAVILASTAEMVLKAAGLTSGLVVDIGVDTTCIVPIFEQNIVPHAVVQLNLGGTHIVDHLASLLRTSSAPFAGLPQDLQNQIALNILQTKAHVEYDPGKGSRETHSPATFQIKTEPIAWQLVADKELYLGPEILFQFGTSTQGSVGNLPDAILRSIDLCDPCVRDELFGAIVLAGRVAKLPGLKRRLMKELVVARHDLLGKLHIEAPEHVEYFAYWGACTMARFASDDQWTLE